MSLSSQVDVEDQDRSSEIVLCHLDASPPPPPSVICPLLSTPPQDSQGPTPLLPRNGSCSSLTASSVATEACRICHCEAEGGIPLISPCSCSGTLKYVHQACLQQWIKSANTKSCELCKLDFQMTTSVKPFRKWQKLDMTKVERRKIVCSVTFHVIAITCVVWSLYVLIDRTTDEIRSNKLEWPFWTKLIVVAIGFTGGLVFMYVQCKMYIQLCRRWRAYNRVIYVQDCPITATVRGRGAVNNRKNTGGGHLTQKSDLTPASVPLRADSCELSML